MAKCIDDIKGLVPGLEKVIADLKAGNENAAIIQLTLMEPKIKAAYTECTGSPSSKKIDFLMDKIKNINLKDLPTCISDIEALIPGVESVIADFKAGDYTKALSDGLALVPELEKAETDCLASKPKKNLGDMQKCIADIQGLVPGLEKVIADLKAGNENAAILQLTLMMPKIEAAYADCTGPSKKAHHIFMKIK
jgi:hypothetical protein